MRYERLDSARILRILRVPRPRSFSQNGIRLTAMGAHTIPNSFVLLFAKDGIEQPARVKWRRGAQIGAEFSAR
jgi:hypothetical protein